MSLESLYQEIILEHYKSPRNFGKLDHPASTVHHENPSCGDQIGLQVAVDDSNKIVDIKFYGRGCAISLASASMMTEAVKGKPLDEARRIISRFKQMFTGGLLPAAEAAMPEVDLGDLEALEGVKKFPTRVKCATLAWGALEKCLEMSEQKK